MQYKEAQRSAENFSWSKILEKTQLLSFDINIEVHTHTALKYLENIEKGFLGNIVRLLKYFETYH